MKLQIPHKIAGVIAVLLIAMVVLCVVGLRGISAVGDQADKLSSVSIKKAEDISQLRGALANAR